MDNFCTYLLRCQGLIPEIEDLCDDIVAEIIDRYNGAIQETLPEVCRQIDIVAEIMDRYNGTRGKQIDRKEDEMLKPCGQYAVESYFAVLLYMDII